MKKLNLLYLLTIIFTLLCEQNITAKTTTANVILSYNTITFDGYNSNTNVYSEDLTINLLYPINKVTFDVQTNKFGGFYQKGTLKINENYNDNQIYNTRVKNNSNQTATINTKSTSVRFFEEFTTGDLATTINVKNTIFTIAPHIALNTQNSEFDIEIGSTDKTITIDFKSFLTKGNLTASVDNNDFFLIDGTTNSKTICGANVLEKINENTKNFNVVFKPKSVGTHTATVTIKDDASGETKTIKITANCIKKTPTINWTSTRQIIVGESMDLTTVASSTCNTGINFSSSDPTIINIENNKLIALKEGKANITATTNGNDTYNSVESIVEFEATIKTLQNIVWEQYFHLLKLGDANVTLNAYATDKETGVANANPITYSVENENIVKITDGVLSVIGKGQTTITATQAGNEDYASATVTKIVYVREVSDNCESNFAYIDNTTHEEGNWSTGFDYSTMTVTTGEFQTVGDKLTFVTTCKSAQDQLFPVTDKEIRVKDQSGNTLFETSEYGTHSVQLPRTANKLTFEVKSNFYHSLSNIIVTPAIYLEASANTINIAGGEIDKTTETSIDFDWANQPDMMFVSIEGDTANVFTLDQNTSVFGGSCGEFGTSKVKFFFAPKKAGAYGANLVVKLGNEENAKTMITLPIIANAIKTPQYITWDQDFKAINPTQGNTYTLEAIASSKLPVKFTSSNDQIARIENNNLVIVGAGEVTITAEQNGNINFEAATPISKTISIAKLDQTITWNQEFDTDLTIGNTVELSVTATSGEAVIFTSSNEAVATIAGNTLTIVGVGEATITATQAGNNNYNAAAEVAKSLSIAKLDQTITWSQDFAGIKINESATLNATASSNLEITYSSNNEEVATIEGNTITIKGAGSVTITATQAGNDTYNPTSIEKTFTFGRATQTITWNDDLSTLKINDVVTLTATTDANLDITYSIDNANIATIEGNTLTIIGAGEATITATQAGNETYNSASATKTINIEYLTQTIAWEQDLTTLTLENEPIELTASATSGLNVTYKSSNTAVATIEGNILTIVGTGEATITARQEGNNQYEATQTTQTINIAKLEQVIAWEQDLSNVTLDRDFIELTAVASSNLTVTYTSSNETVAQINGNILYIMGEGQATITASQSGNDRYNAAETITKEINIFKLNQTITWKQDLSGIKIGETVPLNATSSSSMEITYTSSNENVAIINGTNITIKGAGSVTVTAYAEGNNKYNSTSIEKTFTFGRTAQTITWNDDLSALKINDVVTLTATTDANLDITYSIDNANVATISGNTLTIIGAGEATITATQAGNETYNSATATKTINIDYLTQTIAWEQDLTTLTLESEPIELTATASSGLNVTYKSSNTAVATIEGNILTIVGAGEVTITASQAGNNQYAAVEATQTINVAKLAQTITWEQDLSNITLLNNYIELTATASSNLTVIYTSSNEAVAQINGNILTIKGEGEATITASQAGNDNYEAAVSIEKVIVITKQTQEIIWNQTFTDLDFNDAYYELTAYATSGLPVTYELVEASQDFAILDEDENNILYPSGAGYITIYAYQEGNELYKAAPFVEKTIYINSKEIGVDVENTSATTILYADDVVYFNGEHSTLRVYDMTGRIVYSANVEGTNNHYLPLTQRGIYIISLDNQTLKIVK